MNKRWPDFWSMDDRTLQLNPEKTLIDVQSSCRNDSDLPEMWSHQKVSSPSSAPHSLCLLDSYLLYWEWVSMTPPSLYPTQSRLLCQMLAALSSFAPCLWHSNNVHYRQDAKCHLKSIQAIFYEFQLLSNRTYYGTLDYGGYKGEKILGIPTNGWSQGGQSQL